jgi:purine-binding chemotaxis protein CheW
MTDQNGAVTYVLFTIAGTTYGVPSRDVQHMEMIDHVTPVPNARPFIEGVVFTRGQVVPAMNLRTRFGFERVPLGLATRLLVVRSGDRSIGLVVDTAREFTSIPAAAVQPPNETLAGLSGRYLQGIATLDDRIVLILNLDEVLDFTDAALAVGPSQ